MIRRRVRKERFGYVNSAIKRMMLILNLKNFLRATKLTISLRLQPKYMIRRFWANKR